MARAVTVASGDGMALNDLVGRLFERSPVVRVCASWLRPLAAVMMFPGLSRWSAMAVRTANRKRRRWSSHPACVLLFLWKENIV